MRTPVCFLTLILLAATSFARGPINGEEEMTVIRAGTIITVSGEVIENGEIIIVDGVIELVGRQLDYPRTATVIDARDKVVMPGLIHAHTRHGLENLSRNGVNGNTTVTDELYWEVIDTDVLVEHGITTIGIYPDGTGVTGMASAYRTGGPAGDRQVNGNAYLRITMDNPGRDKNVLRGALRKAREEIEKIKTAREEWEQQQREAAQRAQQEAERQRNDDGGGDGGGDSNTRQDDGPQQQQQAEPAEFKPPQTDATVQPLMDLIEEKATFAPLILISGASDLLHLNDVIADEKFKWNLSISNGGSTDLHNVLDELKEYGGLTLTTPGVSTITQTATRYNVPAALERAGCDVAFMPNGTSERALAGYLAMVADNVRAGMSRDAALKAMTLNAAKALGVDKSVGSIEKGKQADLVILDGDPLNPLSRITQVMINGETVYEAEGDE